MISENDGAQDGIQLEGDGRREEECCTGVWITPIEAVVRQFWADLER